MTSPSGVRASLAWLLVALSPLCFAEKSATPSTKAVKWLQVRGILDPAGVWVMLINAQRAQASDGNLCHKSVLVALDPKESYEDIYAAKVQDDGKLFGKIVKIVTVKRETVKLVYRVDVPAYVDEGCWCDDPNAGLAVLAPGK